jgi:hypothetical protein
LQPQCAAPDECGADRCVGGLPEGLQISSYPAGVGGGFAPEANGLAHDESHWYFTNTPNDENWVWKYPISSAIVGDVPTQSKKVFSSSSYTHIGDLDYFNGYLYIPLELEEPLSGSAIGVLDRDLNEVALRPLEGGSLPWVAVDPTTARLYTAKFNDTKLRVYQIVNPGPDVQFVPMPDVPLRLPPAFYALPIDEEVARLQGGAFSPSGTLYLVSDADGQIGVSPPFSGGIQAIVAETGVARFSWSLQRGVSDEFEGIDYWDLDNERPAGMAAQMRGQVHMLVLENDPLSDDSDHFRLMHFGVPSNVVDQL